MTLRFEAPAPLSQMRVMDEVRKLRLNPDEFVLKFGGALAAHGIREHGDIDLTVTPELFETLRKKGWKLGTVLVGGKPFLRVTRGNVEAHKECWINGVVYTVPDLIKNRKVKRVNGIWVIGLEALQRIKSDIGRDKDRGDAWLIEDYLSKNSLRR